MQSFQWDDHFVTGLAEVDEQHHRLVDFINDFGDVVTRPEGPSYGDIERTYAVLSDYAVHHFADEEQRMAWAGMDARHATHHWREHASFLAELQRLRADLGPGRTERAQPLLDFLVAWLAYHILGSDRAMARQVRLIDAGWTPEAAFDEVERPVEGAVEPLLRALRGLMHQVSERNRELLELNRTLEERVAERTRDLEEANHRLELLALTDVLTGLPNRRQAMARLADAWSESSRLCTPLCLLMIDADGFKQVNDTWGHDAGDDVLRALARGLRDAVRTDDLVCRLGGDEFLVLCPDTPAQGAALVGERVRLAVDGLRVPTGDAEWRGSVSIGVGARTSAMTSKEDLLRAADEAVYRAKRGGRNRVAAAV